MNAEAKTIRIIVRVGKGEGGTWVGKNMYIYIYG